MFDVGNKITNTLHEYWDKFLHAFQLQLAKYFLKQEMLELEVIKKIETYVLCPVPIIGTDC
jgi:hypothetical protein